MTDNNSEPTDTKKLQLRLKRVGVYSDVCHRSIISPDSRWILVLCGEEIGVYECPSGKSIRSLRLKKAIGQGTRKDPVRVSAVPDAADLTTSSPSILDNENDEWMEWTDMLLNPDNPNKQLYSVCEEGLIVLWDYAENGDPSRLWKLPSSVSGLFGLYFRDIRSGQSLIDRSAYVLVKNERKWRKQSGTQDRDASLKNEKAGGQKPLAECQLCAAKLTVRKSTSDSSSTDIKIRKTDGRIKDDGFLPIGSADLQFFVFHSLERDSAKVAFHSSGDFVVSVGGNEVRVHFFQNELFRKHLVGGNREVVCVACHPIQHCIATGDSLGQITLWYGLEDYRGVSKSILHWHTSVVGDLSFSSEGSFLWSGGKESTLVQWSVADGKALDFVARMSGAITRLSAGNQSGLIAVTHFNNDITIVGAQRNIICRIDSLFQPAAARHSAPLLTWNPAFEAVVLRGQPGQLLVCKPNERKIISTMEIVEQNIVSSGIPEEDSQTANAEVDIVTFDDNGSWMATADSLPTKHFGVATFLKFWSVSDAAASSDNKSPKRYNLCTSVIDPHDGEMITKITFTPSSTDSAPMAVSLSKDRLKLWTAQMEKTHTCTRWTWYCFYAGHLDNHTPGAVAFSIKPTLTMAVSFEHIITLWNIQGHYSASMMNGVMCNRQDNSPVRFLAFVDHEEKLLLSASERSICTWNTKNWSNLQTLHLEASAITCDPTCSFFFAYDGKTCIGLSALPTLQVIFQERFHFSKSEKRSFDKGVMASILMPSSFHTENHIEFTGMVKALLLSGDNQLWSIKIGKNDCGYDEQEKEASTVAAIDKENSVENYLEMTRRLAVAKKVEDEEISQLKHLDQNAELALAASIKKLVEVPAHLMTDVTYLLSEHLDCLLAACNTGTENPEKEIDKMELVIECGENNMETNRDSDIDDEPLEEADHEMEEVRPRRKLSQQLSPTTTGSTLTLTSGATVVPAEDEEVDEDDGDEGKDPAMKSWWTERDWSFVRTFSQPIGDRAKIEQELADRLLDAAGLYRRLRARLS